VGRDDNLYLNMEFLNKRKKEFIERFEVKQSDSVFCLSVSALHEPEHTWSNLVTKTFTSKIALTGFI